MALQEHIMDWHQACLVAEKEACLIKSANEKTILPEHNGSESERRQSQKTLMSRADPVSVASNAIAA